jgi:hypothetical protein
MFIFASINHLGATSSDIYSYRSQDQMDFAILVSLFLLWQQMIHAVAFGTSRPITLIKNTHARRT